MIVYDEYNELCEVFPELLNIPVNTVKNPFDNKPLPFFFRFGKDYHAVHFPGCMHIDDVLFELTLDKGAFSTFKLLFALNDIEITAKNITKFIILHEMGHYKSFKDDFNCNYFLYADDSKRQMREFELESCVNNYTNNDRAYKYRILKKERDADRYALEMLSEYILLTTEVEI